MIKFLVINCWLNTTSTEVGGIQEPQHNFGKFTGKKSFTSNRSFPKLPIYHWTEPTTSLKVKYPDLFEAQDIK